MFNKLSIKVCLLLLTAITIQAEYPVLADNYSLINPTASYHEQQFAIEIAVINITPRTEIPDSSSLLLLDGNNYSDADQKRKPIILTLANGPLDDITANGGENKIINIGSSYGQVQEVIENLQKIAAVELLAPIQVITTTYLNQGARMELGCDGEPNSYLFEMQATPYRLYEQVNGLNFDLKSTIQRPLTDKTTKIKDAHYESTFMPVANQDIVALTGFVRGNLMKFDDTKCRNNIMILIGAKRIDSDSAEKLN